MATDGRKVYEGLFIVDSQLASKEPEPAITACRQVLEKHGAMVIRAEFWAERRLAYEIRKNKRGAYVLVAFRADPLKLAEIELECRLTEKIMRYLFLDRDNLPMEKWYCHYETGSRQAREPEPAKAVAAEAAEES